MEEDPKHESKLNDPYYQGICTRNGLVRSGCSAIRVGKRIRTILGVPQ